MEKGDVKKCKKKLNILEIAATDKENLTSKVYKKRMISSNTKTGLGRRLKKSTEVDTNSTTQLTENINQKKKDQSATILESDLTVDNPSENYWKNLAESRRKALDTALKENVDLHNKVNELEYENSRLKTLLDEAKSLVEVLTEMMDSNEDEPTKSENEEKTVDESKDEISDSDLEQMSFQSCI